MEWFNEAFTTAPIYFGMALLGTAVFVLRIGMMLIFGLDDGMDLDGDVGDMDAADHDTGFALLSVLSITSFLMGTGWIGFVCTLQSDLGSFVIALVSMGFGFSMMLLSAGGMYYMKRFQQVGSYDVRSCIGKLGKVYLTVPESGQGEGQVQINVQGRQKVVAAVSRGERIESFTTVRVLDVQGDETLVVEVHGGGESGTG